MSRLPTPMSGTPPRVAGIPIVRALYPHELEWVSSGGGYEIRKWAWAKRVALVNLAKVPLARYHDPIRSTNACSCIRMSRER